MIDIKKTTQKSRENRGRGEETKQGEWLWPTNNYLATPEQRFLFGF